MTTPIIQIQNLSKAYRIGVREKHDDTLVGYMSRLIKAPLKNLKQLRSLDTTKAAGNVAGEGMLWALKDISFDVHEGDVVGIIGRNGAGKSTLLKILSRITEPTGGRATLTGRVSSLLEVGTGFHPELTGRDNIYMNGTILGMTKAEIDRKFEQIVDFSGIEKFLDTPTKRYSSGMAVRLAFAVAAHLDPEILIVDEVLAVGDHDFQQKCIKKMQNVANKGRTVLFVSHNLPAIQNLCNRAVLINHGEVEADGDVQPVLERYLRPNQLSASSDGCYTLHESKPSSPAYLESIKFTDDSGNPIEEACPKAALNIELTYGTSTKILDPRFSLVFRSSHNTNLFMVNSRFHKGRINDLSGSGSISLRIPQLPLLPGRYEIEAWLRGTANGQMQTLDHHLTSALLHVHDSDLFGTGELPNSEHGSVFVDATWEEPHSRVHRA